MTLVSELKKCKMQFPRGDPCDICDHTCWDWPWWISADLTPHRHTVRTRGSASGAQKHSSQKSCYCREVCMYISARGCFSYPWWGLRQSLDQGGATRKGFGGLRRGRADRQRHRSGLFLNSRSDQKQKAVQLKEHGLQKIDLHVI